MTTAPANMAHRNVYGDPCLECEAECGQTCAPYCPESLGVEFLHLDTPGAIDTITCADDCGNDAASDGFVGIRADGTPDPDCSEEWADDGELLACCRCGRVVSQRNLLDMGESVQVLRTLDEPPTL